MNRYFAFWRRGWYAWLMLFALNLTIVLVMVPIAFLVAGNKILYWVSAIVLWLTVGSPYLGYLFERFAANSRRLLPPHAESTFVTDANGDQPDSPT